MEDKPKLVMGSVVFGPGPAFPEVSSKPILEVPVRDGIVQIKSRKTIAQEQLDNEYPDIPRVAKGFDFRDNVKEMDTQFLVELSYQLYARACRMDCSEGLHNRAQELKAEVLRRLTQVTNGRGST